MAKIGRPTDNPATNQFRVRLSDEDLMKLNMCSDALGMNKSDVLRKGIDLVYKGLPNKK